MSKSLSFRIERLAKVAHVLAAGVRNEEVVADDALRVLRHELRRLNTRRAESIPMRSREAQAVLDRYAASGEARPRNGSPDALHCDHVWSLTREMLVEVVSVEGWVAELDRLTEVRCITASENYRLMKVEREGSWGPDKYALVGIEFCS